MLRRTIIALAFPPFKFTPERIGRLTDHQLNQIYNCKRDKHGNPEFPTNLNEMPTDREAFDGWCFDVGINDPELRDELYREMRSKEPDTPRIVEDDG